MGRFVEGQDRAQSVLFPERLDDWIHEDSTVRVIDVFVDELDLRSLGFERADPAATGRPGYSPATLLKIYVYGYLNRVQSSRRLETETQRNLELIWLTGRLTPDFKTIADFRRDNGEAIRKVCKEFVLLCRRMKLFTDGIVAIDGSKFKAVNNRDRNFTDRKLQARIEQLEDSIKRYLVELDRADRDPAAVLPGRVAHLKDKIAKVKQQMQALEAIGEQMKASEDGQISLTDPDARSMATSGRGTGIVGYNVQTAVDAKHHLIVAHEVTNVGHDRDQLAGMAKLAKAAVGENELIALADRGYYEGYEILECERAGVAAVVPKPMTSNNLAEGLFDKRDFVYDAKNDEYRCPAGKIAIYRFTTEEAGKTLHKYWSSDCPQCPMKPRCTKGQNRRISRWEHEEAVFSRAGPEDKPNLKVRRLTKPVKHRLCRAMTRFLVTAPHRSEYPKPITFQAGTRLTVGERFEGCQGWVDWFLCSTPGEEDGWVPLQVLEFIDEKTAVARESYTARELDVDVGDVLESTRTLNGWVWCVRVRDAASGWVPLNNVQEHAPSQAS